MSGMMPGQGIQPSVGEYLSSQQARLAAGEHGRAQMSSAGAAAPLECECGLFAAGRCLECREPFCDRHASLHAGKFTCGPCSDPEVIAHRRAEAQKEADEARDRAERIKRARDEEGARMAARPEMTLSQIIDFVGGRIDDKAAKLRPVTGRELAEVLRRLGRRQETKRYKTFYGLWRVQTLGWLIARSENTEDPDSRRSNATSTYLLDDGRWLGVLAVRHSNGKISIKHAGDADRSWATAYLRALAQGHPLT